MCLILLAVQTHPDFKLVLAANRDEFYERPAAPAGFWDERPDILGGRDLRAGGTWLGITRSGRIAAITNYRDPASLKSQAPSRGNLVSDFLTGDEDAAAYLARLSPTASTYNGFNLVVGNEDRLYWYSNRSHQIHPLSPGIHGLSNHLLDTPWPKVSLGKTALRDILLMTGPPFSTQVLELLGDRSLPSDRELPDTGVGLEWERILSPIFISSPQYGTRSSTLILIDRDDRVTFIERTYNGTSEPCGEMAYEFVIRG